MFQVPCSGFVCWVRGSGFKVRWFQVRCAPRTANSEPRTLNQNHEHEPGTRNPEQELKGRRVLIVGVSTRAAAESAARAGFEVIALDAYADLDQHPSVRALSLPRDFGTAFSPEAVVKRRASCRATRSSISPAWRIIRKPSMRWRRSARCGEIDPMCCVACEIRRRLPQHFAKRGIRAPRVITHDQSGPCRVMSRDGC